MCCFCSLLLSHSLISSPYATLHPTSRCRLSPTIDYPPSSTPQSLLSTAFMLGSGHGHVRGIPSALKCSSPLGRSFTEDHSRESHRHRVKAWRRTASVPSASHAPEGKFYTNKTLLSGTFSQVRRIHMKCVGMSVPHITYIRNQETATKPERSPSFIPSSPSPYCFVLVIVNRGTLYVSL